MTENLGIYLVATNVRSVVVITDPEDAAWLAEPEEAQLLGWAVLDEHPRIVMETIYEQEGEV